MVTAATMTAATMAIPAAVFTASIMARVAYVASSISRFVRVKIVERPRSTLRHRSRISVVRIVAIVDVAIEVYDGHEYRWAGSTNMPPLNQSGP